MSLAHGDRSRDLNQLLSDLVIHPMEAALKDASAEQIVDEAMAYRLIAL
ncbi:hypothetical protein [Streptomyces crystallinus]|uniref:Uncharacterized protein n=1 Tax=Streptomyces crystallinus TaxID=68191 RepID=A0ABN1GHI5_9ACTN